MHTPNPNSEPDKPHKIKLPLTEAVAYAALSALIALACFGLMFARLHKIGTHRFDWLASLLLLFALMRVEGTIKLIVFAVRARRVVLTTRRMEQLQKRAGWQ